MSVTERSATSYISNHYADSRLTRFITQTECKKCGSKLIFIELPPTPNFACNGELVTGG